jgi:hypothetical protein
VAKNGPDALHEAYAEMLEELSQRFTVETNALQVWGGRCGRRVWWWEGQHAKRRTSSWGSS